MELGDFAKKKEYLFLGQKLGNFVIFIFKGWEESFELLLMDISFLSLFFTSKNMLKLFLMD